MYGKSSSLLIVVYPCSTSVTIWSYSQDVAVEQVSLSLLIIVHACSTSVTIWSYSKDVAIEQASLKMHYSTHLGDMEIMKASATQLCCQAVSMWPWHYALYTRKYSQVLAGYV